MLKNKSVKVSDYELILKIWEKSAKATHDFLSKEDFEFFQNEIPKFLDSVELLLWYDEDNVIGFSGTDNQELVMLFLDPSIIGKGYGHQVLTWLMTNKQITHIDVNTQNERAKDFYMKHGFEVDSQDEIDGYGKPYPITHLVKK